MVNSNYGFPLKGISKWFIILLVLTARLASGQQEIAKTPDTSLHKVQFVTVDQGVKLEVLDWGGNGRPLVFLAGSGFDAHVFDTFAPNSLLPITSTASRGADSAPPALLHPQTEITQQTSWAMMSSP